MGFVINAQQPSFEVVKNIPLDNSEFQLQQETC